MRIHFALAPLGTSADDWLQGVGMTLSGVQRALDLLLAQPFIRGREIPAENRKDRHRAQDHAGKVKRGGRHREVEWGDHDLFVWCGTRQHARRISKVRSNKRTEKTSPLNSTVQRYIGRAQRPR